MVNKGDLISKISKMKCELSQLKEDIKHRSDESVSKSTYFFPLNVKSDQLRCEHLHCSQILSQMR